jgi:hypothetical protein
MTAILFTLYKIITLRKVQCFLKICYRSKSQTPVFNSASVSPTWKVGIATVLELLVLGN